MAWHGGDGGGHVIGESRELRTAASPSVYHIDDSLANVKSLYLPSRDLSFILRVNLPATRDNKSALRSRSVRLSRIHRAFILT